MGAWAAHELILQPMRACACGEQRRALGAERAIQVSRPLRPTYPRCVRINGGRCSHPVRRACVGIDWCCRCARCVRAHGKQCRGVRAWIMQAHPMHCQRLAHKLRASVLFTCNWKSSASHPSKSFGTWSWKHCKGSLGKNQGITCFGWPSRRGQLKQKVKPDGDALSGNWERRCVLANAFDNTACITTSVTVPQTCLCPPSGHRL